WYQLSVHDLSPKYTVHNPLQSSRHFWPTLARPLHTVVTLYLDTDGACPIDGPFALTIGRLVHHLQSPTSPTSSAYELALVALFDALRTACQTATAADNDDGWAPASSRHHRHDGSDGEND
ncbi:unnamed protein product, partial [Sphacelaria rigidula]